MNKRLYLTIFLFATLLLVACASSSGDAAGKVVETYFQSIVSSDADKIASVSCSDWESTARDEVASFAGVKARLDNVTCKTIATQGDTATVQCSGAIVATYNNEDQNFDLKERKVKVVKQGQDWLVCGYGE